MEASGVKRRLFHKPVLHILVIAVVGFLAYSNTFNVPFEFDDRFLIVGNPIIQNFNYFIEPSKAKVWGDFYYKTFISRYIGFLTFSFDYAIHRLDVVGYHIFNLTVHVLNAILIYFLVTLTFRTPYFRMQDTRYTIQDKENHKSGIMNRESCIMHQDRIHPFTGSSSLIAIFSALLFATNPLQTQAVTYIWQRITSLATLFYLLSLVMYIKFRIHDTKKMHDAGYTIHDKEKHTSCIMNRESCIVSQASCIMYLASLFSAVLAMKTKEIAFTLPIIIALYEFTFFEGKTKKRLLLLIPFSLTMLIIPLTLIENKSISDIITDMHKAAGTAAIPIGDYLLTEFRVMVTYLRLFFLPINENLDYDYPVYHSCFNRDIFLSSIFLLAIFSLGIYLFFRRGLPRSFRLSAFGIFWFFITSSVEAIFIPISPDLVSMSGIPAIDVIFDHRMYLPSIGIVIAFSTVLFHVFQNRGKAEVRSAAGRIRPHTAELALPGRRERLAEESGSPEATDEFRVKQSAGTAKRMDGRFFLTAGPCLLTSIIIAFSIATYQRNTLWKNEVNLWEDVVKKSPNKARGHNNLGADYKIKGQYDKAIKHFQIAVRLRPDYTGAYINLIDTYRDQGKIDEAINTARSLQK
ncbi:MAG: tetratricopeptide repeat protein [Nitrospirae bacterium]|nr:tetratricopeptide repeat protein [Nitrospirota bacterium]